MIGLLISALVEAATLERDRRLERAQVALRQASVGPDGPAKRHAIVTSCQCWAAIVTWLETDRFESFISGETPDGPIVRWPELEAAAARALGAAKNDTEADRAHRARLTSIHAKLARMRADIDFINDHFNTARQQERAA